MEQMSNNQFENADPWREAILMERNNPEYSKMFLMFLGQYEGPRNNALILGDASLVQAELLLEKQGFQHVVDVDISPTLLDDEVIKKDDERLERIVSSFDQYDPTGEMFDVIYGKSIAFNPKESVEKVMQQLSGSLNGMGIFFAVWARYGDSYRHGIFYSKEELEELYKNANLKIEVMREVDKPSEGLLGRAGRGHEFRILARKNL